MPGIVIMPLELFCVCVKIMKNVICHIEMSQNYLIKKLMLFEIRTKKQRKSPFMGKSQDATL